ncbi:MAG: hypothetical protein JWL62_2349 [Hyphomicrobiales bacterium]|nr:hypothetical protein [Hyphomicrobiales bacterium]
MATRESTTPDLKVCGNCRAFAAQDARCADQESPAFDQTVEANASCSSFHIGFGAAKRLACGTRGDVAQHVPDEPWAENMRLHLSARSQSAMHS